MPDTTIEEFRLVETCGACPEQYDVFDRSNKRVGYLRLRHGWFRVDMPCCGGKTVYEAGPRGEGMFDDDEREFYLTEAIRAIRKELECPTASPT